MADLEKTVAIIFQGKDDLSKDLKSIDTNLRNFEKGLSNMVDPLANLGKTILVVEGALLALITGAMTMAINKAGEFGGSFKEISTLIDASGTDIASFREDVLKYAQDSGKSIADINQSIYKAVSAGINYKDVLAELSTAEKLSIAGRNDLASTTVLLAGTMNAYGAKTEEAGHYSDVFMETVRRGLTTLPELAGSLANVTGIASMGKVPIETLSAAIAALTATGIPTEQAITGMKNVIANIIKPTKEAAGMAAALGIEFNATALKTKGLETVLWDAWRATGGSAEAMNTLFGSIRGLNAATVLASDSAGRFKETLIAMQSVAGTTDAAYAKMAKGFGETNQNLKNNIDVLLIDIGQRFLPTYGEIGRGLSEVFKGVKIGIDSGTFAPVFDYLNGFGARVAEVLREIAKNVPEAMKNIDMSALISSFDNLGGAVAKAFAAIFGEIDLTTAKGMETFLQKLIDGFRVLTDITTGIVNGLNPFFRILGEGLTTFKDISGETAELVGSFLGLAMGVQQLAGAFEVFLNILALKGIAGIISFGWGLKTVAVELGGMATAMTASQFGMIGLAAAAGALLGSWLNQIEAVGNVSQSILKLIDTHNTYFGILTKSKSEYAEIDRQFEASIAVNKKLADAQGDSASSLQKTGESAKTAKDAMSDIYTELDKVAKTVIPAKEISLQVNEPAMRQTMQQVSKLVSETLPDGTIVIKEVFVDDPATTARIYEVGSGIGKMIDTLNSKKISVGFDLADMQARVDSINALKLEKKQIDVQIAREKAEKDIEAVNSLQIRKKQIDVEIAKEQVDVDVKKLNSLKLESKKIDTRLETANLKGDAVSAKDLIDTHLPSKKKVDVNIEITQIKEQSAIIQKSIEWTAKLNIADAEQGTKRLKDMLDSVSVGIKSSGDLLGSLFGNLTKTGGLTADLIKDQIKLENQRRQKEFDLQEKLIGQQLEMNELKLRRMRAGDFKIDITAAGLQPHLQMILFEILKAIQTKANSEAASFLIGL